MLKILFFPGTKNEICVSLVYSGNEMKKFFSFPLYTRETQNLFFVPDFFKEFLIFWRNFRIGMMLSSSWVKLNKKVKKVNLPSRGSNPGQEVKWFPKNDFGRISVDHRSPMLWNLYRKTDGGWRGFTQNPSSSELLWTHLPQLLMKSCSWITPKKLCEASLSMKDSILIINVMRCLLERLFAEVVQCALEACRILDRN